MRNLRRYFAVFVAVAMLLTVMAPAFAADTAPAASMTDAKICETLGMLLGEGNGVTDEYLATTPTRLQSAIMFLRLKGLEKEALAYNGTANFSDVDKVDWDGGKAILGYLKSKPELGFIGNPDGTFDPNATITAQQYYKILLVALGYKEGSDFKYEDTIKFAETKGLKAVANVEKITIKDIATATVEALKATVNGSTKTLVASLVDAKVIDPKKAADTGLVPSTGVEPGKIAVSVKDAKTLLVKFGTAPADTSKVVFTVTRDGNITESLTATWNTDKTEAYLAKSTNLIEGEYKVAVKDDTKDLGSQTVKVEEQKIAKIELLSDTIIRTSDTQGYVRYKVTDQYGTDITNSSLSDNIKWSSSIDTVGNTVYGRIEADIKAGKLTITKDGSTLSQLKDEKVVVVTGIDSESGVSISKALNVSTTIGGIAEISLKGIKDNKKVTTSSSERFFIEYEAKDAFGNIVNDKDTFIKDGGLNDASVYVTPLFEIGKPQNFSVTFVEDPNDNTKAAFEIKEHSKAGSYIVYIVAKSSGKTASLRVDVEGYQDIVKFDLQNPTTDVAVGETVEIPYLALDKAGSQVTDYAVLSSRIGSDGDNRITLSDGIIPTKATDGTLKLLYKASNTGKVILTASCVSYDKYSYDSLEINVKDEAYPKTISTISVTSDIAVGFTVGAKADKFTILDQYGRSMDLRENWCKGNKRYYIRASAYDTSKINVGYKTKGGLDENTFEKGYVVLYDYQKEIGITGKEKGTATIKYELVEYDLSTGSKKVIDTKSQTVTVYDKQDFVAYEIDAFAYPFYSQPGVQSYVYAKMTDPDSSKWTKTTAASQEYKQDYKVRGKTASGVKVELPVAWYTDSNENGTYILAKTTSDTTVFEAVYNTTPTNAPDKIFATNKANFEDKEMSGKALVTVKGYNGVLYSHAVDIVAKKDKPVAQSISAVAEAPTDSGLTASNYPTDEWNWAFYKPLRKINNVANIFEIKEGLVANGGANNKLIGQDSSTTTGRTITRFSETGASVRSPLTFRVKDQYGKEVIDPTYISVSVTPGDGTQTPTDAVQLVNGRYLVYKDASVSLKAGDEINITAVADNGASVTVVIKVVK